MATTDIDCPDCGHKLSRISVYELWCSNCMKSWENVLEEGEKR